jgi:hypothetical protein
LPRARLAAENILLRQQLTKHRDHPMVGRSPITKV